jgi:FkbM family methyltransferase
MNLYNRKYIRKRITSIVNVIFNRLENNNNAVFETNGEERFINEYIASLKSPVTLFDVGGNIGGYTEILVDRCRNRQLEYSIHVFEPTRSCYAELLRKFGSDRGVILNNAGASESNSNAEIYYDTEKSGFASLYQRDLASLNVSMEIKETIRLRRLDEYLKENGISKIDLLKIDIEGHELSALRGMGTYLDPNVVAAIQFEYGGANLDSKTTLREIYRLLESSGFILGKIMKNGVELRPYTSMMENYQYANYVALSKSLVHSNQ